MKTDTQLELEIEMQAGDGLWEPIWSKVNIPMVNQIEHHIYHQIECKVWKKLNIVFSISGLSRTTIDI